MVSTNEIKKRLEAKKSKQGFLLCDICGGFYELQEDELPRDFETCQCGGKLKYVLYPDGSKKNDLDYQKLGIQKDTTSTRGEKTKKKVSKSDMWASKPIKIADERLERKKIDELMSRTDIIIEQNNRIMELLGILTNNNINECSLVGVCPRCGTRITNNSQHCQECGKKI